MTGKLIRRNNGNSVIEFALVLPILLLVIFGIIQYGRAIMTKNILATASREGARIAAVSLGGDTLSVQTRVLQVCNAARVTPTSIRVWWDPVNKIDSVRVTTHFTVIGGKIPMLIPGGRQITDFDMSATTVMKYER